MKRFHPAIATGAFFALASLAVAAERITIVSESKSSELWSPAPGAVRVIAGYPTGVVDKSQDVCVNIGYLINKDGTTSNFTQMKAWSRRSPGVEPKPESVQPFVQSAAAAVSMWRLAPRSGKARAIYTSATFAFDGSKTATPEQIRANCSIGDLPKFVAEAKREEDRRGNLARAQQDAQSRNRDKDSSAYP